MGKENNNPTFTFEMLMQSFAESRKEIKELREAQKETSEQIKELREAQRDTDLQIKRMSKEIGGIGRSNGYFAEEIILDVLEKDMTFAGIKFDDIEQRVPIMDETKRKTLTDIDIVMSNHEATALIEVKHRVEKKDVNELLHNKLKLAKDYFPELKKHKVFLGIGGGSFDADAMKMAKENGIGIIKAVCDKVEYHTEGIRVY